MPGRFVCNMFSSFGCSGIMIGLFPGWRALRSAAFPSSGGGGRTRRTFRQWTSDTFLPFFLFSFLPSFIPSFLPSFLPSFPFLSFPFLSFPFLLPFLQATLVWPRKPTQYRQVSTVKEEEEAEALSPTLACLSVLSCAGVSSFSPFFLLDQRRKEELTV